MYTLHRFLGMGLVLLLVSAAPLRAAESLATAPVTLKTIPGEVVVDALIEAVFQSTVSSQTSGRITEVLVDVDDYVTKGDVLVRFRDKEQRAAMDAAEARVEEARAAFERMQELLAKKLVPQAEFDKAQAALKAASAARAQAREQLEHTVVRAPYSGIVVKREVEPGESATPGKPLMTGLSLESLRAVANVPQAHIDTVRQLQRARVLLPGVPVRSVDGAKLTISPFADAATHTFTVRVELPPGRHGVYPGMFVKVAFVIGEEQRLLLPAAAVVHRSEVTGVYVIKGDVISFRQIRIGQQLADGQIEVLAGLDADESVALDPVSAGVKLKKKRAGNGK
jgi:RND family efflux transporter MFP subunit